MGRESHFIGHVGGDDFVILTDPGLVEEMGNAVLRAFESQAPGLYNAEDRARGYIEVANRRGELERFPFLSVTAVGISTDQSSVTHAAELADRAFELKRLAKLQRIRVVVTERRRAPDVPDQKAS